MVTGIWMDVLLINDKGNGSIYQKDSAHYLMKDTLKGVVIHHGACCDLRL